MGFPATCIHSPRHILSVLRSVMMPPLRGSAWTLPTTRRVRPVTRQIESRGKRGKRGEQKQAIGISRGGRSTKIHVIVDSKGRPLNFTVTGGQVHDSQVVGDMLDTPRPPLAVTADKAYDSQKVRQQIKDEGALPVIPSRSNATKKAYCPKRFYRRRHKIENYFCRIKDWRRIATRYDKLAQNFLAAAVLVGALYWIKL